MNFEHIDGVHHTAKGVTVTIRKHRPSRRVLAITNPPPGVAPRTLRTEVERTSLAWWNGAALQVSSQYGPLVLEEVLQHAWPAEDVPWTVGTVTSIGDRRIGVRTGGADADLAYTGNHVDTVSWHDARLRAMVAVGDTIHYRLADDGRIAAIRHPDPTITEFGLDCLAA